MIVGFDCKKPNFDPMAVGLVRRAVEETNAKIVITSSWRILCSLEDIREAFKYYEWPETLTQQIIGMTPHLHLPRGCEIKKWCEANCNVEDKVVIIDDSEDVSPFTNANFVKTDPRRGFDYDDFHQVIYLLS